MNALTTRALAVVWLALFITSFVVLQLTEPAGDGFTRGLNRLAAFLTWQGGALVAAIVCALVTRGAAANLDARQRRLGYTPLGVSVALVVAIVAIIAFKVLVQPQLPS